MGRPILETLGLLCTCATTCFDKAENSAEPAFSLMQLRYLRELSAAASALPLIMKTHAVSALPKSTVKDLLATITTCSIELRKADSRPVEMREHFDSIRLGALQCLVRLTDSDERAQASLKARLPHRIVSDVFKESMSSGVSEASLYAACSLMQNLSICAASTAPTMSQADVLPSLMDVATSKGLQHGTTHIAATAVRYLLERSHLSKKIVTGNDSAEYDVEVVKWLSLQLVPYIDSILTLESCDLDKTQHGQSIHVEFARIMAVATAHIVDTVFEINQEASWRNIILDQIAEDETDFQVKQQQLSRISMVRRPDGIDPSQVFEALTLLGSKKGVEFVCFLLCSTDSSLHSLALHYLLTLRKAHRGFWAAKHPLSGAETAELKIGSMVEIFNMDVSSNMNGLCGVILAKETASNRCTVEVDSGNGQFTIPIENLYGRGPDLKPKAVADAEAAELEAMIEAARIVEVDVLKLKQDFESSAELTSKRLFELQALRGPIKRLLKEDPMLVGALLASTTPLRERLQQLQGPPGSRLPNGGLLRVLLSGKDLADI